MKPHSSNCMGGQGRTGDQVRDTGASTGLAFLVAMILGFIYIVVVCLLN